MRIWMGLPVLLLAFAGCLAGTDEAAPTDSPGTDLPAIDWDVTAAVDWWEDVVTQGKRDAYLPDTPLTHNQATRETIAATLADAGFDVEIREYALGAFGVTAPDALPVHAYAVVAHRDGTLDSRIAFSAHYDTQTGTIEGAYDNGSGTAAVVHTCVALAKVETRHGLDCLLFDAEEEGIVASSQYVADAKAEGIDYDLVLGFDMVGINWPGHAWKMYQFVGGDVADWLAPFVRSLDYDTLGYPESGVEVRDSNTRNSDEASFASAGYPTVRFAGGESAGDYPEYHGLDDTPAFIYDYVGGRDNWELGFGQIVESAFDLALAFDATSQEALGG